MDQIRKFNLREPKATDRKLDFATYHDLVMAVSRTLGIGLPKDESPAIIRIIELDDDLPAYNESAEADDETGNLPHIDKTGTVCYYDDSSQLWKRDESQQKVTICNPFSHGAFSKGNRYPFVYLNQASKFVPLTVPMDTVACWCIHDVPAYAVCFMKSVLDPTIIVDNPVMRVSRYGLTENGNELTLTDPPSYYDATDPEKVYQFDSDGNVVLDDDGNPVLAAAQPLYRSFAGYADQPLYDSWLQAYQSSSFRNSSHHHLATGISGRYIPVYLHSALGNHRILVNGPTDIPAKTIFLARQPSRVCWALYDESLANPEELWFFSTSTSWGLVSFPNFIKTFPPLTGMYEGCHIKRVGDPNFTSGEGNFGGAIAGYSKYHLTRVARGCLFRRMGRADREKKIVPIIMNPVMFTEEEPDG